MQLTSVLAGQRRGQVSAAFWGGLVRWRRQYTNRVRTGVRSTLFSGAQAPAGLYMSGVRRSRAPGALACATDRAPDAAQVVWYSLRAWIVGALRMTRVGLAMAADARAGKPVTGDDGGDARGSSGWTAAPPDCSLGLSRVRLVGCFRRGASRIEATLLHGQALPLGCSRSRGRASKGGKPAPTSPRSKNLPLR